MVAFKSTDAEDVINMFKRIELLMKYRCKPYIMRYQNKNEKPYEKSKYRSLYIAVARWCNQPNIYKKMSFKEFCLAIQKHVKKDNYICSPLQALLDFEKEYPEEAEYYFNMRYGK